MHKNYLEDLENKNLEDKKAKKEAIRNNYDFFIGFSMNKFDKTDKNGKPYIENGKIDCTNWMANMLTQDKFANFKCATLQAIDKKDKRILTENYMHNIGYELDENSLTAKFFCWSDAGSNPIVLNFFVESSKPRPRNHGKKEYSTHIGPTGKIYYYNNSKTTIQAEKENDSRDFLQMLKNKLINRIEKIKKINHNNKETFFKKNIDSSDSSFDEASYELIKNATNNKFAIKNKNHDIELFTNSNNVVSERYNEICCFPKNKSHNKVSVKRFFVYQSWLSMCEHCRHDQIYNIVEAQLENFPTETIRVINDDMSFKMLSTKQFINTYVKDQKKKQEYLQQLENVLKKYPKDSQPEPIDTINNFKQDCHDLITKVKKIPSYRIKKNLNQKYHTTHMNVNFNTKFFKPKITKKIK